MSKTKPRNFIHRPDRVGPPSFAFRNSSRPMSSDDHRGALSIADFATVPNGDRDWCFPILDEDFDGIADVLPLEIVKASIDRFPGA